MIELVILAGFFSCYWLMNQNPPRQDDHMAWLESTQPEVNWSMDGTFVTVSRFRGTYQDFKSTAPTLTEAIDNVMKVSKHNP